MRIIAGVGAALIAAAVATFILQPFASCGLYLDLFFVKVCEQRITVYGFDPNLVAGSGMLASGAALVLLGVRRGIP